MYSLATLSPRLSDNALMLSERFVLLLIPGSDISRAISSNRLRATYLPAFKVTPYNLAKLVGKACAYPIGLFYGAVVDTVTALNIRSRKGVTGTRLTRAHDYWGILRQTSTDVLGS
jgi:hypothetical protein